VSSSYQSLAIDQQHDAILLSHLLAQFYLSETAEARSKLLSDMLDLLPHPEPRAAPPTCSPHPEDENVQLFYSRFENNNFVLHSHLDVYAYGIFPLASRSFNHSCFPNAVPVYVFDEEGVCMNVKLIRNVQAGEEVRGTGFFSQLSNLNTFFRSQFHTLTLLFPSRHVRNA
jgi:SET and MYND domain-containing protein